jgi:hypothetical protein
MLGIVATGYRVQRGIREWVWMGFLRVRPPVYPPNPGAN